MPRSSNLRSSRSNSRSWSTVSKAAVRSSRQRADIWPLQQPADRWTPSSPPSQCCGTGDMQTYFRHQSIDVEECPDTCPNNLLQQLWDKWQVGHRPEIRQLAVVEPVFLQKWSDDYLLEFRRETAGFQRFIEQRGKERWQQVTHILHQPRRGWVQLTRFVQRRPDQRVTSQSTPSWSKHCRFSVMRCEVIVLTHTVQH